MPGGTRSYEMARRLVAMGHEVNMITAWRVNDRRKGWFITDDSGINVHWLPVPYSNYMSYSQRLVSFVKFAWYAARKASSLQADIVFATSTPLTIALPAVYASYKHSVPMVFEVRDLWPELPIAIGALRHPVLINGAKYLEKWAYQHASSVVALSPGMKSGVVKAGYPSSNVAVIPNGSDNQDFQVNDANSEQFFKSNQLAKDRPLLIYTGTFGRMNGLGYAINLALELLRLGSDIQILLIGDGADRNDILCHAKEMNVLGKNIFIEDSKSKKQIAAIFSAATMASSLFIDLPEMQANSANKFFDALAAGKPIFLNYGGWMHDLVSKHDCGLAMWGKSIGEAAIALENAMHDPEWLRRAGCSARQLAENYFDRDKLAGQLELVLLAVNDNNPEYSERIAPGVYL